MPEPAIIETSVIKVKSTTKNNYGDLIVTPESGEPVKIAAKRDSLFDLFQNGAVVKLLWAEYMHKKYVARAELGTEPPPNAVEPKTSPPKQESRYNPQESTERQSSIEVQNSNNAIPQYANVIAQLNSYGLIQKNDPLILNAINLLRAGLNYNANRMAKWASQGEPPKQEPEPKSGVKGHPEEPMTAVQKDRIKKIVKEKGYDTNLCLAILQREFKVASSSALTKTQADEFIKMLESGEHFKDEPEIKEEAF